MIELCYSPADIAFFIHSHNMGVKAASRLLENIWKNDNLFLLPCYRTNKRKLYLEVHYWTDYLCDKPEIDRELPSVQKDFKTFGKEIEEAAFTSEYFDVDLFFKMTRLQILYLGGRDYVRIALRTLLRTYGYKRRTQALLKYFRECFMFYHMQTYLRGKEECDIGDIGLDEMIIIRVI